MGTLPWSQFWEGKSHSQGTSQHCLSLHVSVECGNPFYLVLFGSIREMLLFGERLWGTSFLLQTLVLAALPLSPSVPARCLQCHAPFPHQACPHHPTCPFPCVLTSLGVLPWGPVLHQGVWVLLEPCRCPTEVWPHQGTWATAELPGGAQVHYRVLGTEGHRGCFALLLPTSLSKLLTVSVAARLGLTWAQQNPIAHQLPMSLGHE